MLFSKVINNSLVVRNQSNIVVYKDGLQIINPPKDIILEDGWKEHISFVEENDYPETIESARSSKIEEINKYKISEEISSFTIDGVDMWYNSETRASLRSRLEAEKLVKLETTLWNNGKSFKFDIDSALDLLNKVEFYAAQCYDVTQGHLSNISNISDIEKIKSYPYKEGYPSKLRFVSSN